MQSGFSVTNPIMPGNLNENQDQPSPISVLELPFEDDNTSLESSGAVKLEHQGISSFSVVEIFVCFDLMD